MNIYQRSLFSLLLGVLLYSKSFGSHLYGGELYYTHVSGNKYTVTMVLYGDCAGTASVFSQLYTATPAIQVYNGTSLYRTMYLKVLAGAGTEVTPVCSGSVGSTTCNGGTVPGVRRFAYSDTITLNTTSSAWKFHSTGYLTASSSAGRSNSITNISVLSTGGSVMSLDATLNNTVLPNSNPTFTTIPTPFFCINVAQEYNPGAVDSNLTDSLTYALVDGIEPSGSTVSYLTGYSATSPLACATGTFSFNTSSGQLTFTPNLTQKSLVVCKVSEYRSGVLVGTSMREMTFIVLSTCSNRSPYGKISSVSGGAAAGNTTVNLCKDDPFLTFNINPIDSDLNNITMTVAGLPAGATLAITGSGTTTPTSVFSWNTSAVAAGAYYFFITYQDNGCPLSSKQTVAYTINVLPKPVFTVSTVSLTTCTKKNVFDIIPAGSGSPWDIKIFQGSVLVRNYTGVSSSKRDSLTVGNYTFRVTNVNGCISELNYVVNPPPVLSIQSIIANPPKCYNSADGSITIAGSGGLSPYRFSVNGSPFVSSGTFTGLSAGSYIMQIRDSNYCIKDTVITFSNPDSIAVSAIAHPALCNAYSSGSVTLLATGGSGLLTYAIGASGSFGTSSIFSSLSSGTYLFKVRDTNNCTKSITSFVTDSIVVVAASVARSNVLCFNGSNGSISISPTNGLPPYTYALDAGTFGTSSVFPSLTAGNYTIHIKDALGCFLDSVVTITQPAKLKINLSAINVSCYSASSGTILASGSGGISPYTFALNSGSFTSTSSFTSLAANSYMITIKDSNNCSKDSTINITQPGPITITSISVTIPKCVGSADGSISISGNGGTGTLKYTIDGGTYATTGTFSGLTAGSHTISIKDSNNCIKDTTFNLLNPDPIVIQSLLTAKPKCYGAADASSIILATGGAGTFEYLIDGGLYGLSGTFAGLAAGTHLIRVKDGNGCTKDTSFNIANRDSITLNAVIRKNLCNTSKNGAVRLIAGGGAGGYSYEKNGSGVFTSNPFFDSLAVGVYTFKTKDFNNCTKTISVEIVDSIRVTTTISVTNALCFEGKDGIIMLNPFIGASPFSYAIGSGSYSGSSSFNLLTAGTYNLHIKDANGCTLDTSATVNHPKKLLLKTVLKTPSCNGYNDGSITVTGAEGTAPYTYAIDTKPYSSLPAFSGLISKTYNLHIKDLNGCIYDTSILLSQPEAIFISAKIKTPLCNGDANGSVLITATCGTPDYLYALDAGIPQSNALLVNLTAGSYTIKITDSRGCLKDSNITISEPTKLAVENTKVINPTCESYADGSILITATGASKPYSFALDEGPYSSKNYFEKLQENQFLVHIKDSNNCLVDTLIQLTGYPKIKFDSSFALPTKCYGYADGGLSLYTSGGNPPLRYNLENTTDTLRAAIYKNLTSKDYIITVIDTTNCHKSFSVTVPQPEPLKITNTLVNNDCTGIDTNGKISVKAEGGTSPYQYLWSFGNNTESVLSGLGNGFYTVYIKDENNCMDSLTSEIIYDNCCTPSIPNAFTPNNDGRNDIIKILRKGDIVLKEFSIYNRYGQQVFTTSDINQGWDGKFNNREEELGVYYYYVRLICGNLKNREVSFKGDITLVR